MAFISKDKEINFYSTRYGAHDCHRIRNYIKTLCSTQQDDALLRHGWVVENCIRGFPTEYANINADQYYFVTEEDFPKLEKAVNGLPRLQFWKSENNRYEKTNWEFWNLLIPAADLHWDEYYGVKVIVLPTAEGFTNDFCKSQREAFRYSLLPTNVLARIAVITQNTYDLDTRYKGHESVLGIDSGIVGNDLVSIQKYHVLKSVDGNEAEALNKLAERFAKVSPDDIYERTMQVSQLAKVIHQSNRQAVHMSHCNDTRPIFASNHLMINNATIVVEEPHLNHSFVGDKVKCQGRYKFDADSNTLEFVGYERSFIFPSEVRESVLRTTYRRLVEALTNGHLVDKDEYDEDRNIAIDFLINDEPVFTDKILKEVHFFQMEYGTNYDVVNVKPVEYDIYLNESVDTFGIRIDECEIELFINGSELDSDHIERFNKYFIDTAKWMHLNVVPEFEDNSYLLHLQLTHLEAKQSGLVK